MYFLQWDVRGAVVRFPVQWRNRGRGLRASFCWRSRAEVELETGQDISFSLWSRWGADPAPAPMVKLSPERVRVLWPDRLELVGVVRGEFR